jgi:uncharacterized protein YdiU (UPF0061 family)
VRDEARLQVSLGIFKDTFETTHTEALARKLGLESFDLEKDSEWVNQLFGLLEETETDYTLFFRALSNWRLVDRDSSDAEGVRFLRAITPAFYASDAPGEKLGRKWIDWGNGYAARIRREGFTDEERIQRMKCVNPKYVLRNYLAQNAIVAAEKGDYAPLERLQKVLETPYEELRGNEDLAEKRPEWARTAPGCSALSCSS